MFLVMGQSDFWLNSLCCAKSRYHLCSSIVMAGNHFLLISSEWNKNQCFGIKVILKTQDPLGKSLATVAGLYYPTAAGGGCMQSPATGPTLNWLANIEQNSTQDLILLLNIMTQSSLLCLRSLLMDLYLGSLKVWIQTDTNSGLDFLFFQIVPLIKFSRIPLVMAVENCLLCLDIISRLM